MSRLKSYEQKQYRKKVSTYIFVFAILVVLLVIFGFNLLINVGIFVSNLTSGKNNTQPLEKKDDFYGTLSIDDLQSATNSAKIVVGGSVSGYNELEFYINGKKVKEISSSAGSFSEEIGDLKVGQNEVYLKAKTKDSGKEKMSEKYDVLYKNEKPKLEISEPPSASTTSKSEIKIAGSTDKEVFIKINDLPVVVNSEGNFQTLINLNEGENNITVTATDNAGNVEAKTFTVTYRKDE